MCVAGSYFGICSGDTSSSPFLLLTAFRGFSPSLETMCTGQGGGVLRHRLRRHAVRDGAHPGGPRQSVPAQSRRAAVVADAQLRPPVRARPQEILDAAVCGARPQEIFDAAVCGENSETESSPWLALSALVVPVMTRVRRRRPRTTPRSPRRYGHASERYIFGLISGAWPQPPAGCHRLRRRRRRRRRRCRPRRRRRRRRRRRHRRRCRRRRHCCRRRFSVGPVPILQAVNWPSAKRRLYSDCALSPPPLQAWAFSSLAAASPCTTVSASFLSRRTYVFGVAVDSLQPAHNNCGRRAM
jgi:hypothetical protein